MSTIIETDLKEVLTNISSKLDKLSDDVNSLKVDMAKLQEGQNGINKRLDNLDFILRTVIGGVILALLAGLAKILYPTRWRLRSGRLRLISLK